MEDTAFKVQSTTDYDQFSYLEANREIAWGHVTSLARIMEEQGNITMTQPIIVNRDMKVIDGQHRLEACKRLELPVYYIVVPDMGVHEARQMNIAHKVWRTDDYAHSYAESGDENYKEYLKLLEDYGFSHGVTLAYINGNSNKGMYSKLRKGELVVSDVAEARKRLDRLTQVAEITPLARERGFAVALLKVMQSPEYNHKSMLNKLTRYGNDILKRFTNLEDNTRQLEEVYNFRNSLDNRTRLF